MARCIAIVDALTSNAVNDSGSPALAGNLMNCRLCPRIMMRSLLASAVPGRAWDRGVEKTWAEILHGIVSQGYTESAPRIGRKKWEKSPAAQRPRVLRSRKFRIEWRGDSFPSLLPRMLAARPAKAKPTDFNSASGIGCRDTVSPHDPVRLRHVIPKQGVRSLLADTSSSRRISAGKSENTHQ